ncbi:YeeE/YedE family protein [Mageeibacillus indolicus UPII9-5]|jgi:hypothetical protein|uniref:YeeE/YedE family protein n=2 Tax=Mageeibacillus indolicus TaxID=884684 RepID=D3QZE5_MAGIU|nr:YeeE/YedE family protein [Mageeibacillus indolicus UPII9-5]
MNEDGTGNMKHTERIVGWIFLIAVLLAGYFLLPTSMLFFRLIIGGLLGYALSRGYMGFAGSVNRAYLTGSTRLMRTLMLMFFVSAAGTVAVLFQADATKFDLWVNPINFGLLLGGIFFGFGMAFSSCCASGVLTDLVTALPRALITLVFFCAGVFLGFPLQNTAGWIKDSWLTSPTGAAIGTKGVYFPDYFKFDGLDGYLGALAVTGVLCIIVVRLSRYYENKRKKTGEYFGHFDEGVQLKIAADKLSENDVPFFSATAYERYFVRPWSLRTAVIVISFIFVVLMGVTKAGWGASTPYGFWFGKVLMQFGVSTDAIVAFTHGAAKPYELPFLLHPITLQNIGILLGTAFYLLSAEQLRDAVKAGYRISAKQGLFYAIGGLAMGFGTRLSNGCNVGALYTPIANFSLSGWIFLVVMVLGGILGNKIAKKVGL